MNFFEIFRIAISSLLINRLRAVLTTLGIIIGVGAVIALISLGRGVETYISTQFQGLGSNILFVFSAGLLVVPSVSTNELLFHQVQGTFQSFHFFFKRRFSSEAASSLLPVADAVLSLRRTRHETRPF